MDVRTRFVPVTSNSVSKAAIQPNIVLLLQRRQLHAYYINNGSDVFACVIDMQKAFDRVDLVKLFQKLRQRPISVFILRVLFHLYYTVDLRVMWNGAYSSHFSSINGVKQGGILFLFLFIIFINDFILEIELNKEGCFVGHIFYGCIACAVDILLPRHYGLCVAC